MPTNGFKVLVCSSCGEPAGATRFCGECGWNLSAAPRLLTRDEWERSRCSPLPGVFTLAGSLADIDAAVQREEAARRTAIETRSDAAAEERRISAQLVDQFMVLMNEACVPGVRSVRRMRVRRPLRTLLGLDDSGGLPFGKNAGAVSGWIVRDYSPHSCSMDGQYESPIKYGLLLGLEGRIYEFSDSIWTVPEDQRPTIHLWYGQDTIGERGYVPGVDDLPLSSEELGVLPTVVVNAADGRLVADP
jgi:hypothetical protein